MGAFFNWKKVNFHRTTREISLETGKEESAVSRARRIHAPETVGKYSNRHGRPFDSDAISRQKINWRWKNETIAKKFNCTVSYIRRLRPK